MRETEAKSVVAADCHMHCAASEDSESTVAELIENAVKRGVDTIAVTDHVELVAFREGEYDVAAEESWRMLGEADVPAGFALLKGIELGEPCFDTALAERLLSAHDYDFVLASQHRLSDALPDYYFIDFSDWSDDRIIEEMRRYFRELIRVASWNGFDSLAHLTYPFRYLPAAWRNGDYSPWLAEIDEIFDILIRNGKSLEINTSGIRKGQGMTSPDEPLIRRYFERGGRRITIGSDAHRPHEVGSDLDAAWAMAKAIGFDGITVYRNRQPITLTLA